MDIIAFFVSSGSMSMFAVFNEKGGKQYLNGS